MKSFLPRAPHRAKKHWRNTPPPIWQSSLFEISLEPISNCLQQD